MAEEYEPTWESLETHSVPSWFANAKLGIWLHWGAYSVPAWAPRGKYAEWYPDRMWDPENETYAYHHEHYGDIEYGEFLDMWEAEAFDPDELAALFEEIGARYVLLTGEHHDGIPLWDSDHSEYTTAKRGPERDLVADLGEAVRARGMKYAPSFHALLNYYQPGYPGHYGHPDYDEDGPGPSYVSYMNKKLRELIDAYRPDLLWLDGDWKADVETFRSKETLAYYYNRALEWDKPVVANDRLGQCREERGDFYTPEYSEYETIQDHKWETCRGIGHSFGYNRNETPEDHLSVTELVQYLADVVSKNGNLLLNLGPKADGTIPEVQLERVRGLGEWLDTFGRAIFGTTPWAIAEDETATVPVRYTWRDGHLYVIGFEWPRESLSLSVPEHVAVDAEINALRVDTETEHAVDVTGETMTISLADEPSGEPATHAWVLELSPIENPRQS